jgi:WXG100 family type VII secretion target
MNGFDVSYARVDQATIELRVQTDTVAKAIEDLDIQMRSIKQKLEGAMADSYDAKVAQWRTNVADMRTLLTRAEMALNSIRDNYQGTDSREAMEWASLM